MQLPRMHTTRLHVMSAIFLMLAGLMIYVYPKPFLAEGHGMVARYIPVISAMTVGSGVLLLVLAQHPIRLRLRRCLGMLPGLPLLAVAAMALRESAWTAGAAYSLTAIALLIAPWAEESPRPDEGLDLWYLTYGSIQVVSAITFLIGPRIYAMPAYVPLHPYMLPLGVAGLFGGAALIWGARSDQRLLPQWLVRLAGSVAPLALIWSFWETGFYTGVLLYGGWTVGLAIGAGAPRGTVPKVPGVDTPYQDSHPATLERLLESWMWLLAFSVVGLTLAESGMATGVPVKAMIFVVAVSIYNTLAFRVLRGRAAVEVRLRCHLTFLCLAVALLLLHTSSIGHGFLALLAALPALATRAIGVRDGYWLLGIGAAAVALPDFLGVNPEDRVIDTLMELILLGVTATVGIRVSAEQRRSATALLERQIELEAALAHARAAEAEKARLAAILEATPDLVAVSDTQGRLIYMNQAGLRLLGLAQKPASSLEIVRHMGSGELDDHLLKVILPTAMREGSWTGEGTLHNREGVAIPVSQVIIAHKEDDGQVHFFSTIQRDIRPQKEAEQARRISEEQFRFAFEGAPIGMGLTNMQGVMLQVNQALCNMLGYSAEEICTLGIAGLTYPDDLKVAVPIDLVHDSGRLYQVEKRYLHKDGHIVWGLLSISLISDSAGRPVYFISHIQDITERKSYERQLMHLASYDPLTDLFNRRRFQAELEQQMQQVARLGGRGALMFIDLDQFKYINDTLGHAAGDEFLRSVANILRHQVRRGHDTAARLGGDEFAVIMPGVGVAEASTMANRVLASLRQHVQVLSGQSVTTTASIGIALYPDHGVTAEDLLARADFAMYQAKERGRNRVYVFCPGSDAIGRAEKKLLWEQRIREALETDRMTLFCQPIWDLREDRISHYELLLRMRGTEGEVIPPGEFLPVAERFGLIQPIDRWVVRQAIRIIADEAAQSRRVELEINLSGLAFSDNELLPLIRSELAETGIDPSCLILEITETTAISDLEQAHQFIATLRDLGCRFAIDDFGSGFASFAYLKHLQVDYLKIDGSFIENLVRDPVDQHLVKGMVEVARGLGKRTIAEFVGDAETMQMLREIGVDFAQGYYIGRPMPRTAESFT
ncbi:MAG TPA: EAL domain-containing protein [Symbiobacteriaceae bacterium]|nr:EAL domain-containing protein [Symbiobacteriaceae bacterium]